MLRSLAGLSVGDAFGERFFGPPEVVASRLRHREWPSGEWRWTDDTAMALSVVEELAKGAPLDPAELGLRFARRFKAEPHRGYGAAAYGLLGELFVGREWAEASRSLFDGQGSKGNGAAMRVAPLGAFFAEDLDLVVQQARVSAQVTHWHEEGQAGAVAGAVAAALVAKGARAQDLLFEVLQRTPAGATREGLERAHRLTFDTPISQAAQALGSGQRVLAEDTVPFALWCAARHLNDFEEAMWATVSGLGDRDTTCAIVGGVVGLRSMIPARFLRAREPLPFLE